MQSSNQYPLTYSIWIWVIMLMALISIVLFIVAPRLAQRFLGIKYEPITYGGIFLILVFFAGGGLFQAVIMFDDTSVNASTFLSDPSTIVLAVAASLYLYWFRGQMPFLYGILEVLIGIVTIFLACINAKADVLARSLAILGGGYIIVRGMDNMDKGCPSRLRKYWDATFPKQAPAKT
jgi:hypothetical protein